MNARKKWLVRSAKHHFKKKRSKFGRLGRAYGNYQFNRKYKKGKAVEGVDFY